MSLTAAIDIGNSTTEILLAEVEPESVRPVWHGCSPTSGRKGEEASLSGAAQLLARGERDAGRTCEGIALTHLRPVDSVSLALAVDREEDGPARALRAPTTQTPAGRGLAAGAHTPLAALSSGAKPAGPLVVSVPAGVDFEDAARVLRAAIEEGWEVVGAIVAGDDAVLIHNRIGSSIPIVDEVELEGLEPGDRVVVEVAEPGRLLGALSDPIALTAALELPPSASAALKGLARAHVDCVAGAVALGSGSGAGSARDRWRPWIELTGVGRLPLEPVVAHRLAEAPFGATERICLDRQRPPYAVADVFAVDLDSVDRGGWVRRGVMSVAGMPLASLAADHATDAAERMGRLADRPVRLLAAEAEASRLGALSTPAASADACVLDLGGGTIDVASALEQITGAGAGELLTVAVAAALRVPELVAESIKRGPLVRIVGPRLIHLEDGSRKYLDDPVRPSAVGKLARIAGEEVVPFELQLAPEEWRGLRLALKEEVLGANVERLLRTLGEPPGSVLTAGGAAEDEELVRILGERLRRQGVVVGRADVGGRFGPRHAVTYGLLRMQAGEGRVDGRR